jgi:hypothetical protein
MASILGAFSAALGAAARGMSANAFQNALREAGAGARRSEVLALYRIARDIHNQSGEEIFRDITQAPHANELTTWPTRSATGIRQNVTLVYRDRTTGQLLRTYYSITSENGVTREAAVAQAIDTYSGHAERYNQDMVGAIHTGAYLYTPM